MKLNVKSFVCIAKQVKWLQNLQINKRIGSCLKKKKSVVICKFESTAEQIIMYQNSDTIISSILREGLLLQSGIVLPKVITTAS